MDEKTPQGASGARADAERTAFGRLDVLGGVELLTARFVNQRFSRHFHERYALGCIESGAMRFRYRGAELVAPAGQVNLVVPGEVHDGHGATPEGWAYRMFYLPPEALQEAAAALMPRPGPPHFVPGVIDDPALAACVLATHRRLCDPAAPLLEKETRLYWLLVNWIARHAETRGDAAVVLDAPRRDPGSAARARRCLEGSLDEDVSLADVARAAHLSPFHLVRVFEREYGLTPHAYRIQVRVRAARALLATGMRLADVAAATGFADQAHLTRLFKRITGVTPGRWRASAQPF
ncbi:MAG: AraC family transcriptional regulator [Desulfovibrionaceae bacterium]|jgi:AraC-like DNA-binding protein|nr:AraC family transcriptional regulator [Desulfovibrionaceae bacterium]